MFWVVYHHYHLPKHEIQAVVMLIFTSVTRYVLEDVCYDGFRVQCVDIL